MPAEDARRIAVIGCGLIPFRGIAHDARPGIIPALEHHFADGQHGGLAVPLDQRNVELAPFDITLGEPVAAIARRAILRTYRDSFAPNDDRSIIKPEGGVLGGRFDDPAAFPDSTPMR